MTSGQANNGLSRRPVKRSTGLAKPQAPTSVVLAVVMLIVASLALAGVVAQLVLSSSTRSVEASAWSVVALVGIVLAVQVLRGVRLAWSASVVALALLVTGTVVVGRPGVLLFLVPPLILLITPSARAWMFTEPVPEGPAT